MKISPSVRWSLALVAGCALLSPAMAFAQDATPPVVASGIPNVTVAAGRAHTTIPLDGVFGLAGVGDQVVRFDTTLGNVDVVLFSGVAPLTVANFLSYVDDGSYVSSFIHRSTSIQDTGLTVIQGGGYYYINDQVTSVPAKPPVVNEFAASNVRSTIAMAKTSDPNSATSQWFFNVDDSPSLDNPGNNGGYTVFGAVITDGMIVVDAISALQTFDEGGAFSQLPLLDSYMGGQIQNSDLVNVNSVTRIPMIPSVNGETALLSLKVSKNTNRDLVTCRIVGNKLRLNYVPGATGRARITVAATDAAGSVARTAFTVTVR